jgi:hypothetical protein
MEDFDIITYMGNMTGFDFKRPVLEQIAVKRGVRNVSDYSELSRREENLILADLLFVIFTSPSTSGSTTKSHGDFSVTVGAATMTDKSDIYKLMMNLYQNPDQELHAAMADLQGGCQWLD